MWEFRKQCILKGAESIKNSYSVPYGLNVVAELNP